MMETGIKQVSSIHIEKTNDRSELLRADEVVRFLFDYENKCLIDLK